MVVPNALPYIVVGLRLAIGRAVLGVVVAEFFGSENGLGVVMVRAASRFQVDVVGPVTRSGQRAQGIAQLLADKSLRTSMGNAGKQYVIQFDRDAVLSKFETILRGKIATRFRGTPVGTDGDPTNVGAAHAPPSDGDQTP